MCGWGFHGEARTLEVVDEGRLERLANASLNNMCLPKRNFRRVRDHLQYKSYNHLRIIFCMVVVRAWSGKGGSIRRGFEGGYMERRAISRTSSNVFSGAVVLLVSVWLRF